MTVDHKEFDKITEKIRKKYGPESVNTGDDFPDPKRLPTGLIEVDTLTGGGFPLGRYSHIFGGYSSGKTLICLNIIAEAQKMGLKCVYYDLENQYQSSWAESAGVNTKELAVVDGSVIEDVATKLEAYLSAAEVHIIDSVGMGVSRDELDADADEWRPGIRGRAWTKLFTRVNERFDRKDNAIIMINQVYEAFGKKTSEQPRGGVMVEYVSSLSLNTIKSSSLYKDKNGNLTNDYNKRDVGANESFQGDLEPAGIELRVKLTKNRIKVPKQLGSTRLRLEFESGGQFDTIWTLVRAAIFNKIVKQTGSWYELPDGSKVQGENGLRELVENNEEFRKMCLSSLKV